MEAIIEEANLLLKEGQWAQVIDLLEPLIASALWTEKRQCFQAIAVAHVMRYGAEGDWVRVLRLQEEEGSDADVKSQFRRLSLLIHPDQCSFHAASEAFVMLSEAQRHLMLKRRGGNIEERSRSTRQKRNEEETADDPSVDEVYSWWSEWTGGRRHVEESCSADYLAELSRLTVEKLRDRVFDLQRKILDQSDVTLEERKKRLRAARSMLSDSMLSSSDVDRDSDFRRAEVVNISHPVEETSAPNKLANQSESNDSVRRVNTQSEGPLLASIINSLRASRAPDASLIAHKSSSGRTLPMIPEVEAEVNQISPFPSILLRKPSSRPSSTPSLGLLNTHSVSAVDRYSRHSQGQTGSSPPHGSPSRLTAERHSQGPPTSPTNLFPVEEGNPRQRRGSGSHRFAEDPVLGGLIKLAVERDSDLKSRLASYTFTESGARSGNPLRHSRSSRREMSQSARLGSPDGSQETKTAPLLFKL